MPLSLGRTRRNLQQQLNRQPRADFDFDLEPKSRHGLAMTGKSKLPDVFSQHPQVMSGALVFKGTRVPVQTFFDHLDHGGTLEEFLEWYDGVAREQLEAAEGIRATTAA